MAEKMVKGFIVIHRVTQANFKKRGKNVASMRLRIGRNLASRVNSFCVHFSENAWNREKRDGNEFIRDELNKKKFGLAVYPCYWWWVFFYTGIQASAFERQNIWMISQIGLALPTSQQV